MSIKISVNKNKEKIDDQLIRIVASKTLEELQDLNKIGADSDIEISIALVSKNKIAELNQQYRQHNGATDVLSFGYENNKKTLEGELILCPTVIKENAREDKIKFEEEFSRNIIHGILHTVGYGHGEKMFSLQNNILNKNKNEYQKIIK